MKTIKTNISWVDKLLPDGFPINTSTIITGPGGSGKPLIGETFAAAWLKEGGSIAFISLQYPSTEFITDSIKEVTGLNLIPYKNKILFFQLDISIENLVKVSDNVFRVNLLKPENWDNAINLCKTKFSSEKPGILIFASALNLLLFSPTYGGKVLNKIKSIMSEDKSLTYMFLVSKTVKEEEISILEKAADNLIVSKSKKQPFKLYLEIMRMKDVPFEKVEIQIPIKSETLMHIKEIADHSRKKVIPEISQI